MKKLPKIHKVKEKDLNNLIYLVTQRQNFTQQVELMFMRMNSAVREQCLRMGLNPDADFKFDLKTCTVSETKVK